MPASLNINGTTRLVVVLGLSILLSIAVFFYEQIGGGTSFGNGGERPMLFFSQQPAVLLLLFLGIVQLVFCINVLPYLIQQIIMFNRMYSVNVRNFVVICSLILFFLLCTLSSIVLTGRLNGVELLDKAGLMHNATIKYNFVIVATYIVLCACVYLMLCVYAVMRSKNDATYEDLVFLKGKLSSTLYIIGFIITASTVSGGLVQHAVGNEKEFPKQMVFAYGLFNSLYLAVVYLPVLFQFMSWGNESIERKLATSGMKLEDNPEQFLKTKMAYQRLFGLEMDFWELCKKAIPILSPLLAGLLSYSGLKV